MGCYVSRAVVHSIVPLSLLEAVRNLDTPVEDGLQEFAEELLVKRLGLSSTVTMQLAQYEVLARRGTRVAPDLVEALLRLVGRRPDADLVFADAGRRAARRAARHLSFLSRSAAGLAPRSLGYAAARRAARRVLGGELRREAHVPVARVADPIAIRATPDGAACGLYAAGFAELLRLLAGYEGAMQHTVCRATGGDRCEWRTTAPDPRHE
jgi:predicted hydrocarbon binding protein